MSDHCLAAQAETSPGGRRLARTDGDAANLALFSALFVVALLPVLATPIPAMVDYVNHLARMYVLAADGTAAASPFYRVQWAFYPNLAMDLIVPRLASLMSVEAATRLFLIMSQILVVTGSVAIEYAVKGRFAHAGYAALIMLYSIPFAWGFVNFEFALGLALWGIACWLALRERPWALRFAAHTAVVICLFVSHLFALGLYGFALGLHELWRARAGASSIRSLLAAAAMLGTPVVVLVALMHATGGTVGQSGNNWFLAMKPFWLLAILNGYSVVLSAICVGGFGFVLHALWKRDAVRFEASGAWLLAGFGLLYLVVPGRMLDTAFVDLRVIVAAALIVSAFVSFSFPSARWRFGLVGVTSAIVLANTAIAADVGLTYRRTYAAMIESFGSIEPGSRVLVAHGGAGEDPPLGDLAEYPIYHAPTLAVHYAQAFVPTLYATTGKQPIALRHEDRRMAASYTGPVPIEILQRIAEGATPVDMPASIRTWVADFDYVYVVGPQAGPLLPSFLEAIWADRRFALYRIRKPARPAGLPVSIRGGEAIDPGGRGSQ